MLTKQKTGLLSSVRALRKNSDREAGFTLIELMVVILIIGILAAIAIPVFMNQQVEAAKSAVKSDVKNTTTTAQEALLSGGFGQLTSDTDGNILVDGATTTADVVASDGVTVAILADESTSETSDYLVTGSSEASGDYAYTFTSRTGRYTDGTAIAAPAAPEPTEDGSDPEWQAMKQSVTTTATDLDAAISANGNQHEFIYTSNGEFVLQNVNGTQVRTGVTAPAELFFSWEESYYVLVAESDGRVYQYSSNSGYYESE